MNWILVPLMALCYRMKGGLWSDKGWGGYLNHVGVLMLGYATAWVAGYGEHWTALVCMLAFWLGEKPGVGGYMGWITGGDIGGKDYEKWQVGYLKKSPYLSAVVRGLIWFLPVLPLAWFYPGYMVAIGMVGAVPLACWMSEWKDWKTADDQWAVIEWMTGALYGAWLAFTLI